MWLKRALLSLFSAFFSRAHYWVNKYIPCIMYCGTRLTKLESCFLSLQGLYVVAEDTTVSLTDLEYTFGERITKDGKAWGWAGEVFYSQGRGVYRVSKSTLKSRPRGAISISLLDLFCSWFTGWGRDIH